MSDKDLTRFELWLEPVMKDLLDQTTVSFKDFEGVLRSFDHAMDKIQEQRMKLQTSRDNWKNKYQDLKQTLKEAKDEEKV